MGRRWADGGGNLFASTIIRLRGDDPPAHTLALVAAVALFDAVDGVLPGRAMLKWPNDLLIEGAKLSGILLERGSGDAVVLGFGVNLAERPVLADRATTCLADHGAIVTPRDIGERLQRSFAARLSEWRRGGVTPIQGAWLAAAHPEGTPLRVRLPGEGEQSGQFAGLDPDGALRLLLPSGAVVVVHAGDVFT